MIPPPPAFGDLGKAAKDLFSKNFNLGVIKIDHKAKCTPAVDINSAFNHTTETGNLSGSLESKYKLPDHGLTFTTKWTTKNLLTAELELDQKIMKGLKQTLEFGLQPNEGRKSTKVKNSYKHGHFNSSLDVDLMKTDNLITGTAVFRPVGEKMESCVTGISFAYNHVDQKVGKLSYAAAYLGKDFHMTGILTNRNLSASVYQRHWCCLQTAFKVDWELTMGTSTYAAALQYKLDGKSFLKSKVDNDLAIGLAYVREIADGVKLTLCGQVDGKNVNAGGHQMGLGIEFES